jgi:hypothetical protein
MRDHEPVRITVNIKGTNRDICKYTLFDIDVLLKGILSWTDRLSNREHLDKMGFDDNTHQRILKLLERPKLTESQIKDIEDAIKAKKDKDKPKEQKVEVPQEDPDPDNISVGSYDEADHLIIRLVNDMLETGPWAGQ